MTRRVAVLRPEPGNRATVSALQRLGLDAVALPLFEVIPMAWEIPALDGYDGLLITSANAVRHAGPGLETVAKLPVFAIGAATARAARRAGLAIAATGSDGAAAIAAVAVARGHRRLLHLAGRDHMPSPPGVTAVVPVYESRALAVAPSDLRAIESGVAMLHSARAARRLGQLIQRGRRSTIRLAALSPVVAGAAGPGWDVVAAASARTDSALVELAAGLAD